MSIVYTLQVWHEGKQLQNFPRQPQPYGSYAMGDEYFVDVIRYSIKKIGHGIVAKPEDNFLVGTLLTLGPPADRAKDQEIAWPW